jgi:anthranilate phosphoribosyltransferase
VCGRAASLKDGISLATQAIDGGVAAATLDRLAAATRGDA